MCELPDRPRESSPPRAAASEHGLEPAFATPVASKGAGPTGQVEARVVCSSTRRLPGMFAARLPQKILERIVHDPSGALRTYNAMRCARFVIAKHAACGHSLPTTQQRTGTVAGTSPAESDEGLKERPQRTAWQEFLLSSRELAPVSPGSCLADQLPNRDWTRLVQIDRCSSMHDEHLVQ